MLHREWPWIAATAVVILVLLLFNFDGYALLDPDEGRNAEVMREMAATNDYVLPHLNGLPYVDKPALYFAVGAIGMEVLGPTVFAARLPSLLFTVASLLVVALFATSLYGRRAGWTAAAITATTPFALAYSRTVIFDSAVMLWVVLAVVGFWWAIEGGKKGQSIRHKGTGIRETGYEDRAVWWRALAWGAMGLGVLTKGPVALALPLMIALPYAGWRRRLRATVDATSVLLFLALVLPWVVAVSREVPGFLQHALVTETAGRLTTDQLGRTGPLWYFLAIFPAAALPWSIVVAAGWWSSRRSRSNIDPRTVFLALWVLVPLVFFTLSQSKRPQYVLPLIPAISLFVAGLWQTEHRHLPGVRAAAAVLLGAGVLLLATRVNIAGWVEAGTEVSSAIPGTAVALGVICSLAGIAAWFAAARRAATLLALALPVAAIPVVSTQLMDAIGRERSAEQLALAIDATQENPPRVVGVHAFPPSLPFYLQRPILLASNDGAELTSNYLVRDIDQWRRLRNSPLRSGTWWREVASNCGIPTVFVVGSDDTESHAFLAGRLPLIIETRKHTAFGPCGGGLMAAASVRQAR